MKRTSILLLTGLLMFSCSKTPEIDTKIKSENSEFVTLKSGIIVEKRGDEYILGGDMILSPMQLKALDENGNLSGEDGKTKDSPDTTIHPVFNIPLAAVEKKEGTLPRNLGMNADPYRLWAMVRFTYGPSILNHPNKNYFINGIRLALNHIQDNTNVRFYNATGQPTVDPTWGFAYPYIEINYVGNLSASSSSHIGRSPEGGKQELRLADFAFPNPPFDNDYSTIVHELCHAIGMMHEQNRPDRDSYVSIKTNNLTTKGLSQFTKVTTNYSYFGAYDFNSIMGYDSYTSSTDHVHNTSLPMYTKLNGDPIVSGTVLSSLDRIWLNNYHLPYIARSDVYRELADVVYDGNNNILTPSQRLQLQAQLNNGNPTPPAGGRIPNDF